MRDWPIQRSAQKNTRRGTKRKWRPAFVFHDGIDPQIGCRPPMSVISFFLFCRGLAAERSKGGHAEVQQPKKKSIEMESIKIS